jgi:hypothetical protein
MGAFPEINWVAYDPCANGHTWGGWITVKPATLTSAGEQQRTCTICGEVDVQQTDKLPLTSTAFTDVPASKWYASYVEEAYQLGLMNGIGDNQFSPLGVTNRAMVVKILYNLSGAANVTGKTNPFVDVSANQWYSSAIEWAYLNQVTSGTSATTFSPNVNVTREQIAVFLYNYCNKPQSDGNLSNFPDASKVHSWGQDAMAWAVDIGIINGVGQSDGTSLLNPNATATRSEVATMFVRFA